MNLRTRITLIICSMIVILMVSLGAMIYIKSASIIDRDSENLMTAQLDRVQENIDLLVSINKLETRELALDKRVEAFLENKISLRNINGYLTDSMREKNKIYSYYMDFFILDKGGHIISSTMPEAMNIDLSQRKYVKESIITGNTVTSDILVGRANGQLIVNTVSPVISLEGETLGYAATAIYADYFSKLVGDLKLGESGYYAIVDSNNLILSHPKRDLIGGESVFSVNRSSFRNNDDKLIKLKAQMGEGDEEFQIYKLMNNTNWILVAALPEADMYKQSKYLLYSAILIGVIALLLAMIIGVYVTNIISVPIVAMTEYLDIISKGNSMIGKSVSESIEILQRNIQRAEEDGVHESLGNNKDEIGKFHSSFSNTKKIFSLMLRKFERESRDLIKSSEQLAHTVEEISQGTGRFISTLSHDLKNSITVIKGYARGLKAGVVEDEAVKKEFINGIYTRTEELEKIIYDVLDSAYEAQSNIKMYKESVSLESFSREISESAREYVENRNHKFEAHIDIEGGILNIDKTKIKRVWNNLINNAVKYSEEGTKVRVRVVQKLNEVRFEVEDEGFGIRQEELDKIFNLFYRGEDVKEKGYGLGLYISKSIVEAHGGRVCVSAGENGGSLFWFCLEVEELL